MDSSHPAAAAIERFNWRKVHRVMEFMKWQWIHLARIPTIEELKQQAYDLVARTDADEEDFVMIYCGGIRVIRNGVTYLIEFVLDFEDSDPDASQWTTNPAAEEAVEALDNDWPDVIG